MRHWSLIWKIQLMVVLLMTPCGPADSDKVSFDSSFESGPHDVHQCFKITHPAESPYELSDDELEDIGIQMIINCPGWPLATSMQVVSNGIRLSDVNLEDWNADMYELSVITRLRGRTNWDLTLLRNTTASPSLPHEEHASVSLNFLRLFGASLVVPFPPPPPSRFAFRRGVGPFFTCRVDEGPAADRHGAMPGYSVALSVRGPAMPDGLDFTYGMVPARPMSRF
jgi:hypothetical protein